MEDELKKLQAEAKKLEKIVSDKEEQKKVLLQDIAKIEKFLVSMGGFERKTTLSDGEAITYKDKEIVCFCVYK